MTNSHHHVLHALATVETAYHHALSQQKSIKQAAGTMYDDWGKKVERGQGKQLRADLLERRQAAVVAGRNT